MQGHSTIERKKNTEGLSGYTLQKHTFNRVPQGAQGINNALDSYVFIFNW